MAAAVKLAPLIVITVPGAPEVGVKFEILGGIGGGGGGGVDVPPTAVAKRVICCCKAAAFDPPKLLSVLPPRYAPV